MKQQHSVSITKSVVLAALSIALAYNTASFAVGIKGKNRTFPYGCRVMGYTYQDDLLLIKPSYDQATSANTPTTTPPITQPKQTIFLIHNKSNHLLQLKAKKEAGEMYKPDNENVIAANQWAAFAMDQDETKFMCLNGTTTVNCGSVLEICQYNHAKFSDSTMGSYWVVKSDTLENTVYGAIHIGILLRW